MTTPPPPPAMAAGSGNNGKAIASMVTGIVSVAICLYWFLALPGGIVALVLGIISRNEIAQGKGANGGMALTGIITGAVAIVLSGILAALVFSNGGTLQYCIDNPDSVFCSNQ